MSAAKSSASRQPGTSRSGPKTLPTSQDVAAFIASRASPQQTAELVALQAIFERVTGETATMWGPSIVGYGRYRYCYASGRTGESCVTGFSIRGREWVVYLVAAGPQQAALLPRFGPHKRGKACLYFKRLADVDLQVLEALVSDSVAEVRQRHP
jgi:hypothetical protein